MAEVGGLVFVWLGRRACAGAHGGRARELARALGAQGIDRARIAHQIDYEVHANWKLVWENNRECWHCHAGHPEYVQANFDAAPDTERHRRAAAARAAEHAAALAELVAPADGHDRPGLYRFPTPRTLVVGQPHAAARGVRHRVARRPAGGAADGRLPRL